MTKLFFNTTTVKIGRGAKLRKFSQVSSTSLCIKRGNQVGEIADTEMFPIMGQRQCEFLLSTQKSSIQDQHGLLREIRV